MQDKGIKGAASGMRCDGEEEAGGHLEHATTQQRPNEKPVTTSFPLDAEDRAAQALFGHLCGDFYRAVVEWGVRLYATTPGGDGAGDDSQETLPYDRYDKFAA